MAPAIAVISDVHDDRMAWHLTRLGVEGVAFLRDLPLALRRSAFGRNWLFVHATPRDLRDAIGPEDEEDAVWRKISDAAADAIVMGHIHRPYVRRVRGTLLVNTGAVGAPFDGDARASSTTTRACCVEAARKRPRPPALGPAHRRAPSGVEPPRQGALQAGRPAAHRGSARTRTGATLRRQPPGIAASP